MKCLPYIYCLHLSAVLGKSGNLFHKLALPGAYGLSSDASIGVLHIAILRCSEASASSLHWKAFYVNKAVRGLEMLHDLRYL